MTEFTDRYYPTICIRRAEMRAMEKLPPSEKVKMLPIVLLAPWLNSIKFENTFDRIEKSIGDLPIVVDLDRFYQSSSELESRRYFRSLLGGTGSIDRWVDLIDEHQKYIPCIQWFNRSDSEIDFQVEHFSKLGRGTVFRIEVGRSEGPSFVLDHLGKLDLDNSLIVIDGGWANYSLELQAKLDSYIGQLTAFSEAVRITVCTSNFPNSFSDLDNMAAVEISSRHFYSELRKKYGNYQIFYGDWASTKPRRYDGGGNKPLARIDYPLKDRWVISRSKDEEWDYVEAAKRVTRLPEWLERPQVWGASMIEKTAENLPGAISSGPEAIASRVNIHLFLQNNFSIDNVSVVPTDAPWVDPL